LGRPVLSHDFVEAAWIRRAGWAVALDPDTSGSAEEAPQTLASFHARDRRWCQGNLQHLRLLAEPGLDPVSRLHLALGVLSYLVAPIWLPLSPSWPSAVAREGALPLAVVAASCSCPSSARFLDRWPRPGRAAARSCCALLWGSWPSPALSRRSSCCDRRVPCWPSARARLRLEIGSRRSEPPFAPVWARLRRAGPSLCLAIFVAGLRRSGLRPVALPLCLAPLVMRVMDAPA
jgi:membrane glycosyltransferase